MKVGTGRRRTRSGEAEQTNSQVGVEWSVQSVCAAVETWDCPKNPTKIVAAAAAEPELGKT